MIEPLEMCLRARLGQVIRNQSMIAVIEPLEVCLRARFGRAGSLWWLIAVIEPLEVCLRARLGRTGRKTVECPTGTGKNVIYLLLSG